MQEGTQFEKALETLRWFRAHAEIHSLLLLGEELLEAILADRAHPPARIWEFVDLPSIVKIIE